jgi:membrane-bound acyltransferase YfiQ involved in biofilm formation
LGILCAVLVTHQLVAPDLTHHAGHGIVAIVFAAMGFALFETAFWFVPNLLLCIAVLLIFRRHLYSPWLGAGLLLANLVYVVNIYKLWFPSQHTVALFAFVFYLWLGSYAAQNFQKISGFCARVPAWVFLVLSILSGAAAYSETCLLKSLHNPDPLNTLRLSNQIFSIFVVLLIFKFTRATWPGIVDVRRHTFGLYLTHAIVLTFLLYPLKRIHLPAGSSVRAADVASVALWATTAIGTYLICLGVTRWLAGNSSLEWMVGLFPQEPRRSKDRVGSESSDLIQV